MKMTQHGIYVNKMPTLREFSEETRRVLKGTVSHKITNDEVCRNTECEKTRKKWDATYFWKGSQGTILFEKKGRSCQHNLPPCGSCLIVRDSKTKLFLLPIEEQLPRAPHLTLKFEGVEELLLWEKKLRKHLKVYSFPITICPNQIFDEGERILHISRKFLVISQFKRREHCIIYQESLKDCKVELIIQTDNLACLVLHSAGAVDRIEFNATDIRRIKEHLYMLQCPPRKNSNTYSGSTTLIPSPRHRTLAERTWSFSTGSSGNSDESNTSFTEVARIDKQSSEYFNVTADRPETKTRAHSSLQKDIAMERCSLNGRSSDISTRKISLETQNTHFRIMTSQEEGKCGQSNGMSTKNCVGGSYNLEEANNTYIEIEETDPAYLTLLSGDSDTTGIHFSSQEDICLEESSLNGSTCRLNNEEDSRRVPHTQSLTSPTRNEPKSLPPKSLMLKGEVENDPISQKGCEQLFTSEQNVTSTSPKGPMLYSFDYNDDYKTSDSKNVGSGRYVNFAAIKQNSFLAHSLNSGISGKPLARECDCDAPPVPPRRGGHRKSRKKVNVGIYLFGSKSVACDMWSFAAILIRCKDEKTFQRIKELEDVCGNELLISCRSIVVSNDLSVKLLELPENFEAMSDLTQTVSFLDIDTLSPVAWITLDFHFRCREEAPSQFIAQLQIIPDKECENDRPISHLSALRIRVRKVFCVSPERTRKTSLKIPISLKERIQFCQKLDLEDTLQRNWKWFAAEVGLSNLDIQIIEANKNTSCTEQVLRTLERSQSEFCSLELLRSVVEGMKRLDAAEHLAEEKLS